MDPIRFMLGHTLCRFRQKQCFAAGNKTALTATKAQQKVVFSGDLNQRTRIDELHIAIVR
jgi:hypothetical protein